MAQSRLSITQRKAEIRTGAEAKRKQAPPRDYIEQERGYRTDQAIVFCTRDESGRWEIITFSRSGRGERQEEGKGEVR